LRDSHGLDHEGSWGTWHVEQLPVGERDGQSLLRAIGRSLHLMLYGTTLLLSGLQDAVVFTSHANRAQIETTVTVGLEMLGSGLA